MQSCGPNSPSILLNTNQVDNPFDLGSAALCQSLAESKAWLRRGQSINTRGKRRFPLEAGAIGSKMYRAA
jgi:hypothetical protein